MPFPLGAALTAGGSLLGGLFGSIGSAVQGSKNRSQQWKILQAQQAYNDSVISRNEAFAREAWDYNSPVNVRARLEEAGYNPYLTDASLGSAQAVSSSSGSASLPSPTETNPLAPLGAAVSSLGSSFQDFLTKQKAIDSQQVSNDIQTYEFQKQKDNDAVKSGDMSAYFAPGYQQIFQIENARNQSNISATQAAVLKMKEDFYTSAYIDENGQPIVDENGEAVNNFVVENLSQVQSAAKGVEKLLQDIQQGKVNLENAQVDTLIKKYTHDYLQPAQLANLQKQLSVLQSQIYANNASARYNLSAAFNQMQQGITAKTLLPGLSSKLGYEADKAFYDSSISEILSKGHYLDYLDRKLDYDSSIPYQEWKKDGFLSGFANNIVGGVFRLAGDYLKSGVGPVIGPILKYAK